ncbi:BamA/TamA family outer membrane protein [Pedobacter mucosus]|uniref:BamA/TamA family outer membrane protein n=1 Tax=Pedobacter mucosus TaxID=2895286 RepID=UPI001EE3C933|nr:BamA/TamA family outer membrane protein [Pedobacter mucosus]UKT63140.1 polymerase [Pedobacter mucosus]
MKKYYFLFVIVLFTQSSFAQMKLIKRMLSNEKDTTRKASFMPVPVFGYAQETGFEFGVGALYSFYMDRKDTTNRSSNFSGTASYSTKKTYSITLKGDAWTKGNLYHAIGEIRFKKMPFNFYGLGNNTSNTDEDKLVQQQVKVLFDLEKTFIKHAYTGVSLGFENYSFEDKIIGGIYSLDPSILGRPGGKVFFTGVSQSYDTRNSNNYPSKGFFGRVTYQYAPDFFGGNNFTGSQLKLNIRNFWKLSNKFILGAQGLYHTVQSNNTPFYLLPQLGNDEMMRGYYTGRYRDKNLLALQTELRYRYSNRFGAMVFAGAGTVWGKSDFDVDAFKPNLGAGVRYFFDPAKGLSVRLDYGIGEKKGTEKRQSGFYISLAEAF